MIQQPPSRPLGDEVVRTGSPGEVGRPGRARPAPHRPWTGQDFMWWHTAAVLTATRQGRRSNPVLPIIDPVCPTLGSGEVTLATCDAELLMWRCGDAVYNPSWSFFLTGGPVGLALTVAFFGGQAYPNHRRWRAAEADAVERRCRLVNARLSVSTHGIYLGTGEGVIPISYADIQEVQLTATGETVIAATNASGSVRLKIRVQWAGLVLILWLVRYMPGHPQPVERT